MSVTMHCVLHVGTAKTASTLLQEWLFENEAALSEQGVALSHASGAPNNRKLVAYFQGHADEFLANRDVKTPEEAAAYFAGYEEELAAEFEAKRAAHHTLLLTSEHFHSRMIEPDAIAKLKAFLDRFFTSYSVICYFREQARVRTSAYSTSVKLGNDKAVSAFQPHATPNSHFYNYAVFFGKWEAVFGKAALRPRLFDRTHLMDGDIRKDVLAAVLPGVSAEALNFDTRSANRSLTDAEAQLYRAINNARPNTARRFRDPTSFVLRRIVSRMPFLAKGAPIQDTRQAEMYAAFEESNVTFFERYFGEARNLFEPPEPSLETSEEPRFSVDEVANLVGAIAGTDRFALVDRPEAHLLADLADRLHASSAITREEAIGLLRIANRAHPTDEGVLKTLERVRGSKPSR